ncbi:MAG TPA: clostripain-related cysteine peptidase [Patescibacteria group bacterium]|nr:clostripain-related cysteine peptidase [Patescibacteria group bacterium]
MKRASFFIFLFILVFKEFRVSAIDTKTTIHYLSAIDEFNHWEQTNLPIKKSIPSVPLAPKPWTFIVYMAADNDLRNFAARNIQQMATIGSNKNINIIVHLDIKMSATQKVTRHYYVADNTSIYHMNAHDPHTQSMDSGNPNTLVVTCGWAASDFPAENYALILWNHGTGILDPAKYKISHPDFFVFNEASNLFDIDRSITFIDFIERGNRGVCWDDTTGNFLTNQKFCAALNYIYQYILGKKFSIIGFDACLMAMLEIANVTAPYADIIVASQEVEMGAGWDYQKTLQQFAYEAPSPIDFAKNMVSSYQKTYGTLTNDYTLSAINLSSVAKIEGNVHVLAELLLDAIDQQINNSVIFTIKAAANPSICTCFEEPTYIDLYDFYDHLLANIKKFRFKNNNQESFQLLTNLVSTLQNGQTLILSAVFANVTGKNLSKAKGLSIYFPQRSVHSSYPLTPFAQKNSWFKLVKACLK